MARRPDHQLLARGQLALETPSNFGDVDTGFAHEHAMLSDLDHTAVHRRLDPALDDKRVAIGDLGTLQLDIGTHDQLAHIVLAGPGRSWIFVQLGLGRLSFGSFGPYRIGGRYRGQDLLELAVGALGWLRPDLARTRRIFSPAKIVEHERSFKSESLWTEKG